MTVLSEEQLFVQNQKIQKKPLKRQLQLTVSLEADQLETEQEPAHGQFGSKRLAAMNADAIRRLTIIYLWGRECEGGGTLKIS